MTIFHFLRAVYSSFGAILEFQNGWAFGLRDRTRSHRDHRNRAQLSQTDRAKKNRAEPGGANAYPWSMLFNEQACFIINSNQPITVLTSYR